jgi:hypothetical protein
MKKIILAATPLFFTSMLFAQHSVVMKNGDKMEGLVTSLNNGVIEIHKNQTISKINLSEVSEIIFDKPGPQATNEIGEKTMTAGPYQIRYKVADRVISKAPRIDNMTQKRGTVVVSVSINKYGNVIKATPGAPGSTTSDEYLLTKAKQGAESAIFNNVPTAPLEQTGYITIPF